MFLRTTVARLALLCAVLPSIALAACGDADDEELVAVDVWVRSLCSAAARFDTASDEAGSAFVESDLDDTAAAKEAFAESVEAQREAQREFREEFGELGKPDVEDPDAVINAFRDQFRENDDLIRNVGEQVADFDEDESFIDAFFELEIPEPDFRAKLTPLVDDDPAVQDLIDEIDANPDCAVTIFSADEEPDPQPTTEPTAGTDATPAPSVAANPRNEAWAAGVCGSLLDWITDLETANQALEVETELASDAEDLKQILIAFLEQGLSDTDDFAFEMFVLSPPDVADGEAIQDVFLDVALDLSFLFEQFVDEAHALDATSLASVSADLEAFESRIDAAFLEVGEAFEELDDYDLAELDFLFATLPECVALGE